MFTGIIEEIGTIHGTAIEDDIQQYQIKASAEFISDIQLGDSIAVNGVCLTASKIQQDLFHVDRLG